MDKDKKSRLIGIQYPPANDVLRIGDIAQRWAWSGKNIEQFLSKPNVREQMQNSNLDLSCTKIKALKSLDNRTIFIYLVYDNEHEYLVTDVGEELSLNIFYIGMDASEEMVKIQEETKYSMKKDILYPVQEVMTAIYNQELALLDLGLGKGRSQ